MTQKEEIIELALSEAHRLVGEGVAERQAVDWAVELATNRVTRKRSALGDLATDAEALAKKGQIAFSPYLWIASVVGFLMAVSNTQKISKIYGSWRAGKRGLRLGKLPEE